MNFLSFGKIFPSNWVEEAKLLFFIKMKVNSCFPKKKKRQNEAEKKNSRDKKEAKFSKKKPN